MADASAASGLLKASQIEQPVAAGVNADLELTSFLHPVREQQQVHSEQAELRVIVARNETVGRKEVRNVRQKLTEFHADGREPSCETARVGRYPDRKENDLLLRRLFGEG